MYMYSVHCVVCLLCFQRYEKLAKAQLKKVTKLYAQEKKKSEERDKKEVTLIYSVHCKSQMFMYNYPANYLVKLSFSLILYIKQVC